MNPKGSGCNWMQADGLEVGHLLTACRRHGRPIEMTELSDVVATNEKKRFAFSEDGLRIRANQGHSVDVELGYTPQAPPARLYHGTATRFIDSIRLTGLDKRERHHVHLSADLETAVKVGRRHGHPVVLVVKADLMSGAGHTFYLSNNGVWLTDRVPAEFIEFSATDVS